MFNFPHLKTSNKISLIFSVFNFLSLVLLLISINVIYFFVWMNNQKQESMYDMNVNYDSYTEGMSKNNIEAFKKYILQKDTLIIPNDGEKIICSNGVSKKLHGDVDLIEGKYFYTDEDKTYFVFSNDYESIGEVKVLFDITPYLNSQIIIIKISAIIIIIFLFLSLLLGRLFAKYSLKKLKYISKKASEIDLDKHIKFIEIEGNREDEINILSEALNKTFEKIKCSNDNMKQFITDVSHEFKTPLMIINSKIDLHNKLVEKKKDNKQELAKLLLSIKGNTKKLNKLIETLFLLSRVSGGIQKLEIKQIDLGGYIISNLSSYDSYLSEKNIKLKTKIEKNILVDIETSTFNIILENIITNSIKFSKQNSIIEIGLNKTGFYVADFGVGIQKEDLNKIWDKFYRKDTNKEGFGVGLFLVKRIVDLYNWHIEVESELGKGTKFIIKFK